MSSNSFPCLHSDLVDLDEAASCRVAHLSLPNCRCELPPSRKKRNKEWHRIIVLRRALRDRDRIDGSGTCVPLQKRIFAGHWRFVKVTDQALRTAVGLEVASVVARCTERRLGKKKYPKSFFTASETRSGAHLKPVSEWLLPLCEKDFGDGELPLSCRSKCFKSEIHSHKEGSKIMEHLVYTPKIPRWMIEFGHERHYHTEQWIPNGAALTEIDHVTKFLIQSGAFGLFHGRFICDRWRDLSLVKKSILERLLTSESLEQSLEVTPSRGFLHF